jgi:hypothetical protein
MMDISTTIVHMPPSYGRSRAPCVQYLVHRHSVETESKCQKQEKAMSLMHLLPQVQYSK